MLAVGLGAALEALGDGLVVAPEWLPDEQVTELPSAERMHTICDPFAGDDDGDADGVGFVVLGMRTIWSLRC
jgi:hypothetical protein